VALSDALKAEALKRPGPLCTVCILITTLTKSDVEALDAAMADLAVTSSAIARALQSEGHEVRAETVRRHRAKQCARS